VPKLDFTPLTAHLQQQTLDHSRTKGPTNLYQMPAFDTVKDKPPMQPQILSRNFQEEEILDLSGVPPSDTASVTPSSQVGNVDPIFFKSLSVKPRDYFTKDTFQEVYEAKAQKREQSILKAAQSLL
jgi:hypothetical protein